MVKQFGLSESQSVYSNLRSTTYQLWALGQCIYCFLDHAPHLGNEEANIRLIGLLCGENQMRQLFDKIMILCLSSTNCFGTVISRANRVPGPELCLYKAEAGTLQAHVKPYPRATGSMPTLCSE